jgi:hypothetical protein
MQSSGVNRILGPFPPLGQQRLDAQAGGGRGVQHVDRPRDGARERIAIPVGILIDRFDRNRIASRAVSIEVERIVRDVRPVAAGEDPGCLRSLPLEPGNLR